MILSPSGSKDCLLPPPLGLKISSSELLSERLVCLSIDSCLLIVIWRTLPPKLYFEGLIMLLDLLSSVSVKQVLVLPQSQRILIVTYSLVIADA